MTKGLVAKKSYFAAVQCLDIDTVNAYLAQGGDINTQDEVGNNLLWHLATMVYPDTLLRLELVNFAAQLMALGIDAKQHNKWGISPVYEAVGMGFYELVEIMTKQGIKLTDHISLNEFLFYKWPRHPSRQQRQDFPHVLTLLLNEKPSLTATYQEHRHLLPLQIACKEGATQAILQLLAAEAEPNLVAAKHGLGSRVSPIESLCNLAYRAKRECYEAIDALLRAGANPNQFSQDDTQATNSKPALVWAVIYGGNTPKVVERLLKAGAQPRLKDMAGLDAIYWAQQSKRDDLVGLLLQYATSH